MSWTRIFIDSQPEVGASFDLPPEESHHLTKVLRAKPGEAFEAVSPSGRVCLAELGGDGSGVVKSVLEESGGFAGRRVVLYQAVPKGKRMEVVVEKAVEVGVDAIVPILTERSVVRPGDGNKLERWRRIAESAARQSLRRGVPEVSEPVSFEAAVREAGTGVILHNAPDLPFLEEVVGRTSDDIALFVGPEGGFTDGELEFAEESGIIPAQMGPYRLRSETAGLVAVVRARAVIELSRADVSGNRIYPENENDIPEGRMR